MASPAPPKIDRRTLLIGGGAGIGLVVAWGLWPRRYSGNLTADKGESVFGAWLKIGDDGHVTVAVPQAEHGQGVYTTLPQIIADELGADWRTVAVEAAPFNPLYANALGARELFEQPGDGLIKTWREAHAGRMGLMLTAGSTSVRAFEDPLRAAGAAARVLLCKAAARRWKVEWQACTTAEGFVVHGNNRLRFAELATEAVGGTLPDPLPLRGDGGDRLSGQSLPRLDGPSKIDGSANFAGDVRLPDMVYASIRQGPVGDSTLMRVDRTAAERVRGVLQVVTNDRWVAAIANNWWAANKALDALAPRFETKSPAVSSASINAALKAALDGPGARIARQGDLSAVFKGARVVTADYHVGLAAHAAIETMTATAQYRDGRLELWLPTQAPGLARSAAAAAIGVGEDAVLVHPMLIGGSFGANLETQCAAQAAVLAHSLKRPVQLVWSRSEDLLHDRYRPPAMARMAARLGGNGQILGWLAKIAAPATGQELAARLLAHDAGFRAAQAVAPFGDGYAVAGATPFYRIPAYAIDHHPADIGVPTGHWRSGAHSYTTFFLPSVFWMNWRMLRGPSRCPSASACWAGMRGWRGACRPPRRLAVGKAALREAGRALLVTAFAAAISRCWSRRMSARARRSASIASSRRSIAGGRSTPTSSASKSKAGCYSAWRRRPAVRPGSRPIWPKRAALAISACHAWPTRPTLRSS